MGDRQSISKFEKFWWIIWKLKNTIHYGFIKIINVFGLNVYGIRDFYSPIPVLTDLKKNLTRWYKPTELIGVNIDLHKLCEYLQYLESQYSNEFHKFNYGVERKGGFGLGFTEIDAKLVYYMIRDIKPANYIEVGSGLSTLYASYASQANQIEGNTVKISCVEPYPKEKLYTIPDIEIIAEKVQDLDYARLDRLKDGDILFIDTTHILKIDGDVAYLYLEILPRLKKGVTIHIHDIPFPYNVPHPANSYIFDRKSKPWFFNEAMLLQAFLSYNDAYEIIMSVPYINHFDQQFLIDNIENFLEIQNRIYPPCSIWLKKVK